MEISDPFFKFAYNLDYREYCNKYYVMRFDRLFDRYLFLLSNNFVTRELCTPEFMEICLEFFGPSCLKQFINILGEEDIPEYIKIYAMQLDHYDGDALGYLKSPSNAVIDAALKTSGQSIRHIPKNKQTNHQKLLAIRHSIGTPELIREIDKPTTQMKKIHAMRYQEGIDYIINPNEEIKIASARYHGIHVLKQKNMQNPSEQVILTAIQYTLATELEYYLTYIPPHPNHKIMCAIRHQINMVKENYKRWELERANDTSRNSCYSELDRLRHTLYMEHFDEVIEISNKYYRDEAAQIKALKTLYEKSPPTNPFAELCNQAVLNPQRS